jgi:NAD(P)-dependent dehydrogenase (short-subunit alcohol dehydrogenase family)
MPRDTRWRFLMAIDATTAASLTTYPIKGTTALVTGANRGIGRAIVDALLARGAAKVYATARNVDSLKALVAASGGRVVPLQLDVTNPEQIRAAAAAASDVRLLINNAGIVKKMGGDITDPQWIQAGRDEFETNVIGVLAVTQAFTPTLTQRPGGAIVNLASVVSLVNIPVVASYSVSKAAVHSLTQATRAYLAPHQVYVAGVYPGPIDTDMARDFPMEKTSVEVTANAILDGIEARREEIFPDPYSQQLGALYQRDPKAVEIQYAAPPVASAA